MSALTILPNLPRPCRSLHVERIDPQSYLKIKHIAEDWQKIAQRKITIDSDRLDVYSRLIASSTIARSIALECHILLCNPARGVEMQKEIYVCKDEADALQGIALVSKKPNELRVDYVMTHPANIRCKANDLEPRRVEGAGRAFCAFLEAEGPKEGIQSVYLKALPPSIPFYLKFGFTEESVGKLVKTLPAKL